MVVRKILDSEKVLHILATLAAQQVPDYLDGTVSASFDEDGNVEIVFTGTEKPNSLN